jgi:hypothetical protein
MEQIFAEMVRLHPLSEVLGQVEPAPPLALIDGERRLRRALAARDFPTSTALAKRLALTEGWGARLAASVRQTDSLWGTLGQVIVARRRRLEEVEAQLGALETRIRTAPSPAGRLPLVKEQTALCIALEFQVWLQQRCEESVALFGDNPVHRALAMIGMEAYLDAPDTWQWGLDIGQQIAKVLTPEDISMADTN